MTLAFRIERVSNQLPEDYQRIVTEASDEGIGNLIKLQKAWVAGEERFNQNNAGLFAAFSHQTLIGVGGLTLETGYSEPAMRMRRFYVSPRFRRAGVAQSLAKHCMHRGLENVNALTCNAGASQIAGPFWEAMGFERCDLPNITHVYHRLQSE